MAAIIFEIPINNFRCFPILSHDNNVRIYLKNSDEFFMKKSRWHATQENEISFLENEFHENIKYELFL